MFLNFKNTGPRKVFKNTEPVRYCKMKSGQNLRSQKRNVSAETWNVRKHSSFTVSNLAYPRETLKNIWLLLKWLKCLEWSSNCHRYEIFTNVIFLYKFLCGRLEAYLYSCTSTSNAVRIFTSNVKNNEWTKSFLMHHN